MKEPLPCRVASWRCADGIYFPYSSLSAFDFAAFSAKLPFYADLFGIHCTGNIKARHHSGHMAWHKAALKMSSTS
jgi:hypothetical protein